mmetsp:Transcript_12808/g.27150  ORF Transcript_12808/g.27150 Transcript_12808/m.27150 type:complete len:97 (+) Transcript_12808:2105-2395(+)
MYAAIGFEGIEQKRDPALITVEAPLTRRSDFVMMKRRNGMLYINREKLLCKLSSSSESLRFVFFEAEASAPNLRNAGAMNSSGSAGHRERTSSINF